MTAQPPRLRLFRPIISFDLETTGLDIGNDKVVEICCVKLHVDGRREIQTRRLNPGRPIAPQATAVHGITDADVANCPRFEHAAAELHAFFAGCDLTGFNIEHFDLPFLANEFSRAGFGFPAADARVIDTFRIFTMREPRDLSAALRFYCNRDLTDAHQAEADAIAAADVLLAQVERYSDLPSEVAGLHSVCRPPEWLDGQGKIVWDDDEAVISFGKHKGKSLRVMADTEASYLQWMCRDNKFAPDMTEIIKAALRGQFPTREVMAVSVAVEEAMAEAEEVLVELPEPAVAEHLAAEHAAADQAKLERAAAALGGVESPRHHIPLERTYDDKAAAERLAAALGTLSRPSTEHRGHTSVAERNSAERNTERPAATLAHADRANGDPLVATPANPQRTIGDRHVVTAPPDRVNVDRAATTSANTDRPTASQASAAAKPQLTLFG